MDYYTIIPALVVNVRPEGETVEGNTRYRVTLWDANTRVRIEALTPESSSVGFAAATFIRGDAVVAEVSVRGWESPTLDAIRPFSDEDRHLVEAHRQHVFPLLEEGRNPRL